jgi:ABC-2 type transport system permease protein
MAGSALLLAAAGVATGLGYWVRASGVPAGTEVARMLGAGLAQLPAAGVIVGIAVLALGLLPKAAVAVSWTAFGLALAVNLFGQSLQLSHWLLDVSPFTHAPRLPGGAVSATPLLWLSLLALAGVTAGLAVLRRRDIG